MTFFEELKRRNVVRVGIAYAVVGWVLAQIAEFAFETFEAPAWVLKTFVVVLLLGLPLALFFAWAFEVTPDGIKREKDVDRSQSITARTGRKLDRIIIGVLVLAVGLLLADKFVFDNSINDDEIVATKGHQSIAVLPFVNMSNDEDYFSDGLSEELLNLLAKIPDLKVAGRTSSFSFKGRNEDLRTIGDQLGVNHVLEGSVRRSGDRLRITAQLIKVDDGFHVWSETYDRHLADIFDIQDDVAGAISDALKLTLTPQADRPTDNTQAYSLYLQAVAIAADLNDGIVDPIISLLDEALAIDPGFAKAHELKAMAYWLVGGWTIDSPVAQRLAYDSAMAALAIDPNLVIARAFSVSADPFNWKWSVELEALETAYRAMPNDAMLLNSLAYDLHANGYFRESVGVAEKMIELDPLAAIGYIRKGSALSSLGLRQQAHEQWRRAYELGGAIGASSIGGDFTITGDHELAREWWQKAADAGLPQAQGFETMYDRALDPQTGKQFLLDWLEAQASQAQDFDRRHSVYFWLIYFGFLDELWARVDYLDAITESSWNNTDTLLSVALVFRRSELVRHPKFLPFRKSDSTTELWDKRGPPDMCSKVGGEWVCE